MSDHLIRNTRDQLDRLIRELKDLENCKDDLDNEDYQDAREEALEQLKEFKESLDKMTSGNIRLTDDMMAMKSAIRAAISEAFNTPDVIRMFASRRPDDLRQKLSELERDLKVGKVQEDVGIGQKCEILGALYKLGQILSPAETEFLKRNACSFHDLGQFAEVNESESKIKDASKILAMAKTF